MTAICTLRNYSKWKILVQREKRTEVDEGGFFCDGFVWFDVVWFYGVI